MLIILSKSPWSENFDTILEIARETVQKGEKVAVLHIQDACIAATINENCRRLADKKISIYALKADLQARGLIDKVPQIVRVIDYKQWVKLVMIEHRKIISWTA
jgi:sulfur relay protein TusB/DsrH